MPDQAAEEEHYVIVVGISVEKAKNGILKVWLRYASDLTVVAATVRLIDDTGDYVAQKSHPSVKGKLRRITPLNRYLRQESERLIPNRTVEENQPRQQRPKARNYDRLPINFAENQILDIRTCFGPAQRFGEPLRCKQLTSLSVSKANHRVDGVAEDTAREQLAHLIRRPTHQESGRVNAGAEPPRQKDVRFADHRRGQSQAARAVQSAIEREKRHRGACSAEALAKAML